MIAQPKEFLIEGERTLLGALEDGVWRGVVELEQITGLASFQVRSMVRSLCRLRLIRRGRTVDTVGQYSITDAGWEQLGRYRQLELH